MTILRIQTPAVALTRGTAADDPVKKYIERLVLLIPAEVVALYLAGKALILTTPPGQPTAKVDTSYWVAWTLFCLAAVIAVRVWGTSNRQAGIKPQWPAVAIAAVSFVVWVYSFGDVFIVTKVPWEARAAGLIVMAWTFIIPFLYRGDTDTGEQIEESIERRRMRAGAAGGVLVGLARTPPASFTEDEAMDAVITCARRYSAGIFPSDKVSVRFTDAASMGVLLGDIQDLIDERHGIWVALTRQPADEIEKARTKSYENLALWVLDKVASTGRPYTQRRENDQ